MFGPSTSVDKASALESRVEVVTSNNFYMKAGAAIAAVVILIARPSPAHAQQRLTATVPFDFVVGDSLMPAGDYVVTEMVGAGVVSIANTRGGHSAFVLTIPTQLDQEVPLPELVFKRFGGQHFLSQIIDDGLDGREIPLTTAIMSRKLQTVTVALNRN